jgi:hypothetical protein
MAGNIMFPIVPNGLSTFVSNNKSGHLPKKIPILFVLIVRFNNWTFFSLAHRPLPKPGEIDAGYPAPDI